MQRSIDPPVGRGRKWLFLAITWGLLTGTLFALISIATLSSGRAASLPLDHPISLAQVVYAPTSVAWSDFTPTGWVSAMPMTSSVTAFAPNGLVPTSAAYATSTDSGNTWSAWSTVGLTVSETTTTTQILTVSGLVLPDSATANRIRYQIKEEGGNPEVSPPYTILVDTTAPGAPQSLRAEPGGWTNSSTFTATWTNPPDLSGIAGAWYKLDSPPAAPNDGAFSTTMNVISGINPPTDGQHLLFVWLQDQAGRTDHTHTATTTLFVDRTSPSPPSGLQGNPARSWTNINSFSERWTDPPDLSGVVGVYYQLNRPGQFPTDGTFVSTTGILTNIAVPSDGKHDLYIWLVDAAGNTDQNNRNVDPQVFWYDSTPPTSSVTLDPPLQATGWYSTPVTAAFSGTDGTSGSGVSAVLHQLDASGWSTLPSLQISDDGLHQLAYYARDVAGNLEPTRSMTVGLDFVPPVVTLVPERAPQASGWYTAPVGFTLAIADTLSPSSIGHYRFDEGPWQSGTQFQVTSDGSHQIEYYAQDLAGNRSPLQVTQVQFDSTPPATAYLIDGSQSPSGWYTSSVTVRLFPADAGSGIAATYYRIADELWQVGDTFQLTMDGIYRLQFYSVDMAGNIESSFPVEAKLDGVAPHAPTAVETIPSTWTGVNRFSVQWANPTDLSGISGVYYLMDREPLGPDDGTFSPLTNRLDNLTVPAEGGHRLYLWLRDSAGNSDHRNRAVAPELRYDTTPPTTTLRIEGELGTDGWYRSPLSVTLDAVDPYAGVVAVRYRVDGGAWIVGSSLSITTPDKHILEYASEDAVGNVERTKQTTLRIDPNPPSAPISVQAEPAGWQRYNSFRLVWQDPVDQSGIAGAYVRFDQPPSDPRDGTFYRASGVIEGLEVPGEGKREVFLWLQDGAGNVDHRTAVALPEALWYDGTPPTTVVTITGILGQDGWYHSPVSFAMSTTDSASGVEATRWQVDANGWKDGNTLTLEGDGQHVVRITSLDRAGNVEPEHVYQVRIDRQPPVASIAFLSRYQANSRFDVEWSGFDPDPGSGLLSFDVQVRDGLNGAWQNWLSNTTLTKASFSGQRGSSYFFRVRARDRSGHEQEWSGDDAYTIVDAVSNGSFDTGNFSSWTSTGLLRKAVVPTDGPAGSSVLAARLGSPEYGPSVDEPGQVPVGNAMITQTVTVPTLNQVPRPTLTLWYRVLSYDVVYSQNKEKYFDTFEVWIYDAVGNSLTSDPLLRDGNWTQQYGQLTDTGWRMATLDLTSYAGQTVQLVLANYNREDNMFNTWSFVDGIQVQGWPYNRQQYLPAAMTGDGSQALGASDSEAPNPVLPRSAGEMETPTAEGIGANQTGKR